jgi:primosomal protein N'
MERTIISKVKVLEVYPDAVCLESNLPPFKSMFIIENTTQTNQFQKSEGKAWENAYQKLRAEQRKAQGNAPKEITAIRIKPTVKTAIIAKHGSVQKWVDAMTQDFLTK